MNKYIRSPRSALSSGLPLVLVLALAVRIALVPLYANLPNGTLDEGFWKHWMEVIHDHGVLNIFRESDTDYVGYHWILWLLAIVYDWIGGPYTQNTPSLHVLVKVPSLVFDFVLITVTYVVTRNLFNDASFNVTAHPHRLALLAAAICAFQPAVLYDSAVWAQTDAAISAAMLGSLALAFRQRPVWCGIVFALGFAVKPHPIIVAPLLAVSLLRGGGPRAAIRAVLAAVATLLTILAPWLLHGDGNRILDVYGTLFTKERQRLSELAWNVWWIPDQAGDPRPSSAMFNSIGALTYERVAFTLAACATLLAVGYGVRNRSFLAILVAAAYQAFAFYELSIGAHERYLYPLLILLLPVVLVRPRWLWLYLPLSVTFFLNLVVVAPPIERFMDKYVYGDFGVAIAAVNTFLFVIFSGVLIQGCIGSFFRERAVRRLGPRREPPDHPSAASPAWNPPVADEPKLYPQGGARV